VGRARTVVDLLAGLWGAAAVQLMYPLAETVVKAMVLTGAMTPVHKGISNMNPEGWFNLGATAVLLSESGDSAPNRGRS
jgi:hypothetical protein